MARGATVKVEGSDSNDVPEQKVTKRRCVSSACVPCRKRKSKCDGGTPVCATCTAVYKTDCYYDAESEGRRAKTVLKRDNAALIDTSTSTSGSAELILNSIRSLPEDEVHDFIQQIRREESLDVGALAELLKKSVNLPPKTVPGHVSLEGDLSLLIGKPAVTQTGVSRHFGHTSALGLVTEDENYSGPLRRNPSPRPPGPGGQIQDTWTSVTKDVQFVLHLFDLYFKWSHPFYVLFSRECFYKDFKSGREKYCCPLLVNAICAFGCHFSDDPRARTDPNDPRTAGDHFFAEARKLLYDNEAASLTTVQALAVMGVREPSAGRDSSGFMYAGRCMRMAIEMGLHLSFSLAPTSLGLTPSEQEVRRVTFWGCFCFDTAWSVCIGRISQLPRAAINVDKPMLAEPISQNLLDPKKIADLSLMPAPITTRLFLQAISALSEIINDTVFMFYAPKDRFTSRKLLDHYAKYQNWYKTLAPSLQLSPDKREPPQPHVLSLHMYYHTVVLHLFRPLLKAEILHSDIRPRDICIESANKVSELIRIYRAHYNFRACNLILTHVFLSTCVVHLLFSAQIESSAVYLAECLEALEELSTAHHFGARCFKIVYELSRTWDLPFPERLRGSKLLPREQDVVLSHSSMSFYPVHAQATAPDQPQHNGYVQHNISDRRDSLSMFATSTPPMQHQQPPLAQHQHDHRTSRRPHNLSTQPNNVHSSYAPVPVSAHSTQPQVTASYPGYPSLQRISSAEQQLFWTPIQGMGVPLLPRNAQVSPMDLNTMLGGDDEWEKFSRDGFKMSDNWVQEPMGYVGEMSGIPGQGLHQGVMQQGGMGQEHLQQGNLQHDGLAGQGGQQGGYEWWGGGGAGGHGVG